MLENNLSIKLAFNGAGKTATENMITKPVFSAVFALLMCISANSFIYLPFSPVPVTMQVFTVLLSAVILGRRWAAASQIQYIISGICGLPVFAGFKSGPAALLGPTGGYIAGFVAGAFITGYIYDRYKEDRTGPSEYKHPDDITKFVKKLLPETIIFLACIAGLAVIYIGGYVHLTGFLYLSGSSTKTFLNIIAEAFKIGIVPFILTDMIKIALILNLFKFKGNHEEN